MNVIKIKYSCSGLDNAPPPPPFLSTWNLRMWPYLETGPLQMELVKTKSY